jgi:hypothetical protein
MTDTPLLAFFTIMDNQGGVIVKGKSHVQLRTHPTRELSAQDQLTRLPLDPPKFDLDLYIQNYRGTSQRFPVSQDLTYSPVCRSHPI